MLWALIVQRLPATTAGLVSLAVPLCGVALAWLLLGERPDLAEAAGMLLIGIAAGHWLVRERFAPLAPLGRLPAALRWLGRHSLVVYLVHQPLLIGLLWLALRFA